MKYQVIQSDTARVVATFAGVLNAVRLTGCTVSSGSNVLSGLSSVTGLFPLMGVSGPGIPRGSFIAAIKDADEVVLACSKFDATTKLWTTSEANAQATGSTSGATIVFHGHAGVPIVDFYALGTYRDDIDHEGSVQLVTGTSPTWASAGTVTTKGMAAYIEPSEAAYAIASATNTAAPTVKGTLAIGVDDRITHALPRHKVEPWGRWVFVSTDGHLGHFPASDGFAVINSAES
jgi:hypothetical protein